MTVTADDKKRIVLVSAKPGQSFDYVQDSAGRIILRPLTPSPAEVEGPASVLKLSRRKGSLPRVEGVSVSRAEIVRALQEDRESRP